MRYKYWLQIATLLVGLYAIWGLLVELKYSSGGMLAFWQLFNGTVILFLLTGCFYLLAKWFVKSNPLGLG